MSETVERLKAHFGGNIGEAESMFLRNIQQLAMKTQLGNSFSDFCDAVLKDIRAIAKCNFVINAGFKSSTKAELKRRGKSRLTDEERFFLKDVSELIDFAIRNGLSFLFVIEVLAHDLGEINFKGSLRLAKAKGFSPKVTGWAALNNKKLVGESALQE